MDILRNKNKKNQPITLDEKSLSAFEEVKGRLLEATLLVHPKAEAPLCLVVDAADVE